MTNLMTGPSIFCQKAALLVLVPVALSVTLAGQDIPCSCQKHTGRKSAMLEDAGNQPSVYRPLKHSIPSAPDPVYYNSQTGAKRLEFMVFLGWDHKYKRWDYFLKEEMNYNENGRMISWRDYTWDKGDSHWNTPRNAAKMVYDESGNLVYHVRKDSYYDSIVYYGNGLMKFRQTDDYDLYCPFFCIELWHRTSSTFDIYGKLSTVLRYDRDNSTGNWMPREKSDYSHDSLYSGTTILTYSWVDTSGAWIPAELDSSFYSPSGKTEHIEIYEWKDSLGLWDYSMTEEYTYDHNGNIILWTRGDEREEYTYDPDGNLTLWIRNGDKSIEHSYDESGNKISTSWYNWQDSSWIFYDREEYEYDSWGQMLVWTDYDAEGQLNLRNRYFYDQSYSREDLILPPLEYLFFNPDLENGYGLPCYFNCPPDYPVHMLTGYMKYAFVDGEWWFLTRGTLYYSNEPTSITDLPVQKLKVYPNPASDYLTFDLDHAPAGMLIEIYDIHGKRVMNLKKSGPLFTVPVRDLSQGIYLYRVVCDGDLYNGRFLIE